MSFCRQKVGINPISTRQSLERLFDTEILINKVRFVQSKVDKCVFYPGKVMYVLYTDDSILAGPEKDPQITIHKIATEDQPADFLTKALNEELLVRHGKEVMGW